MALRNAFGALGLDTTLQAIRDRLPTLSAGGRMPVDIGTGPIGTDDAGRLLTLDTALAELLTTLRDTVLRRTDPLPPGTNVIGRVMDVLEPRTLLTLASQARATSGLAPAFATGDLTRAAIDVNVSAVAGVGPSLRVFLDRQGTDGLWYPIWSPAAITAVGTLSTTVGQGMTVGQSLASTCRFRWEISGTTPSFTFSASVQGK